MKLDDAVDQTASVRYGLGIEHNLLRNRKSIESSKAAPSSTVLRMLNFIAAPSAEADEAEQGSSLLTNAGGEDGS